MAGELYHLAKWREGQPLDQSRWWQLGEYPTLEAACTAGDTLSTKGDLLAIRQGQCTIATRIPGEAWQWCMHSR